MVMMMTMMVVLVMVMMVMIDNDTTAMVIIDEGHNEFKVSISSVDGLYVRYVKSPVISN